jgi:hypothetical protein
LTATLLRITNPRFAGLGLLQLGVLVAITVLGFLWLGRNLPALPWLDSDSQSYLQFSPVRPHGYPLFLAAYRFLFPDLAYLASFQLAAYFAAVLLLAVAVARRTASFPAGAAVLLLTIAAADTAEFPSAVSDPLYAAALISGTACLILYGASRRGLWLLLGAAGIGGGPDHTCRRRRSAAGAPPRRCGGTCLCPIPPAKNCGVLCFADHPALLRRSIQPTRP